MSSDEGTIIVKWLRASHTRRMLARALGGGDHPPDLYLTMATGVIGKLVEQVQRTPWLAPDVYELTGDTMTEEDIHILDWALGIADGAAPAGTNVWYAEIVDALRSRGYGLKRTA